MAKASAPINITKHRIDVAIYCIVWILVDLRFITRELKMNCQLEVSLDDIEE